ncbi:hypothetical protein Landi51_02066 [Colletotrichum acutatum]
MDHSYAQQKGGRNANPMTGSDARTAQNTSMHYSQPQVVDYSYVENGFHPVPEPDKIVGAPYYHQYNEVPGMPSHPHEKVTSKKKDMWYALGNVHTLVHTGIPSGAAGYRRGGTWEHACKTELGNLKPQKRGRDKVSISISTGRRVNTDTHHRTTGPDANATATTAAPAATTTWVEVVDWEYIGCYEDASNRVFPDKYTDIEDQTNRLRAGVCSGYEYFGTEFGDQ